jgi:hypothetical protein
MDEKSTPIANLNNRSDDSEVVNEILNKYNNLQNSPSQSQQQTELENNFENRNLNNEVYNANMDNTSYKQHHESELQRVQQQHYQQQQYQQQLPQGGNDDNEYEEYEEYEVLELPLWKRILNDVRIPLIIFFLILVFFNPTFDKFLILRAPYLGNQYNESNTYGFLFKALLVAVVSYISIKFIKL